MSALATLGLEVESSPGQTCTYETLVAAETLALLAFVGEVFSDVGAIGLTAVDIELMGFGGSVPVTLSSARAFHAGQPRVPDETFSESMQIGVADLREDPRPVARSLLDRFFASFLPEHTDVVGLVA